MIITVYVYIKKVSHLPSQLGIFVFTFTVKRFHIYGALLHLALKVFTFTGPYYIFLLIAGITVLYHRMTYLEFDRGGPNMGVEHSFHYIPEMLMIV